MEKAIGRKDLFALAWFAALVAVVAQGALELELEGATLDARWLLEWRVLPILIWAAASPWILDLGARLPVRGNAALRDLALHAGAAGAWVYASNVLMRLPGVAGGASWVSLPGEALEGAVRYGPGALALYAALALVGRAVAEHGDQAVGNDASPRPPGHDGHAPAGTGPEGGTRATLARPGATGADANGDRARERLALREGLHIHLVPRRELLWVEADSDHVRVHAERRSFRVRGTMRAFERELAPCGFLRIHRSALVHPRAVREIQPYFHGDYVAILHDGTELRIPRTRRGAIDTLLSLSPVKGS